MNIKFMLSILLGKVILFLTHIFKLGGGSAAPGLYALKLYPDLVTKLTSEIPETIVITGTNGKTTTARMLGHLIESQGLKVIRNVTGSNMERGIASALLHNLALHLRGVKLNYDLGIWELDEAAFNTVGPKLSPDIIVFLNLFRDQLDRYGEVDSIIKKWGKTVSGFPKKTKIFINGDDASLLELKKYFKGSIQTFGVENFKIGGEKKLIDEKQELNFEAKNIEQVGLSGTKFELETKTGKWGIFLSIPGIYHVYDFLAAFSVALELELKPIAIINSFKNFSPAFGRVEKFSLTPSRCEAKEGYIFLIKNPVGATQVFQTIKPELKENDRLIIALNDNFADGTDVSWIWDANFESILNSARAQSRDFTIFCSGTRAEDLALRLKYAGFNTKRLIIEGSLKNAFRRASSDLQGRLFILPTYTCLLELQHILTKLGLKKEYWKEN